MKLSCLFALLLVVGATVMFLNIFSPTRASDLIETNSGDKATRIAAVSRKLKENGNSNNIGDMGEVSLTDYDVDPVPTSSKFLEPGPIQHGSPLNPYIPKPPPPGDYD
ncbi:hypothetical protein LR48_Vigan07g266300 [Vigna angularis]|uniref:Uncharacterized protein n=2 Tax=Phaseolus angularis TaxID=3914 RepID=A0A0L9V2L3_PHAAN|nr:uncharacterized protein LOC108337847 [Vigna angularis]KAG2390319.1 uncharacterized protein HKW66_Vig0222750 [Vigna angularis]KOM48959.1 hypothetical protein LR48_Vigan07g266300 [Vigna angularis]BAT82607.1 hypothetical protein VIGAN_03264800 [Vigna angularis var. angularis]